MADDRSQELDPCDRAGQIVDLSAANHPRQAMTHVWLMSDAEDSFRRRPGDPTEQFIQIDTGCESIFLPNRHLIPPDGLRDGFCGLLCPNQRAVQDQFGGRFAVKTLAKSE